MGCKRTKAERRRDRVEARRAWNSRQPRQIVPSLKVPLAAVVSGIILTGSEIVLSSKIEEEIGGPVPAGKYTLELNGVLYNGQILGKHNKNYLVKLGARI
ncbi:MAG: hypothetical protein ABIB47_05240 [Candidatus Woesearchaeota archaeon]